MLQLGCARMGQPVLAVGETVILLHPLFTPIEKPTEGRGGCSRMTVSPTAARVRTRPLSRHSRTATSPFIPAPTMQTFSCVQAWRRTLERAAVVTFKMVDTFPRSATPCESM